MIVEGTVHEADGAFVLEVDGSTIGVVVHKADGAFVLEVDGSTIGVVDGAAHVVGDKIVGTFVRMVVHVASRCAVAQYRTEEVAVVGKHLASVVESPLVKRMDMMLLC